MQTTVGLCALTCIAGLAIATAQQPAFEAVSIRRSERIDHASDLGIQPGSGLRTINMPPLALISIAYRVQSNQIVDAPNWLREDRYDILAKAPEGTPAGTEALFLMIRGLFEDRFRLRVRRESRELAIYRLVRANPGGTPPRLKATDVDCAVQIGTKADQRCASRIAPGFFMMFGFPLRTLTRSLAPFVDRPIVDQTGLTGNWEATLEWAPDRVAPDAPPPARDAPSLPTALQEQLGLKLEAGRGPVEVLVVDSVSRPTDN